MGAGKLLYMAIPRLATDDRGIPDAAGRSDRNAGGSGRMRSAAPAEWHPAHPPDRGENERNTYSESAYPLTLNCYSTRPTA